MRKLYTVEKISAIRGAENSDNLEIAVIKGWEAVVKKGAFKEGELISYFEIDSMIPRSEETEFLFRGKGKEASSARLKTARLRGNLSQGLVMSLESTKALYKALKDQEIDETFLVEGTDLTELFNIIKYEPDLPEAEGAKPADKVWEISKTDEERYQNAGKLLSAIEGQPFYGSVKLDGTSMTVILNIDENGEPEVNVCGRNLCYIEDAQNKYWNIANKYDLKAKMLAHYEKTGVRLAFQGELCGPKIQGNKLGLAENDFFVFNVFSANGQEGFTPVRFSDAMTTVTSFGISFVPIEYCGDAYGYKKEDLQSLTAIKYNKYFPGADPKQNIEGIVFRTQDMSVSFKVISNEFLLKGGE